jgi:hypothetical protein
MRGGTRAGPEDVRLISSSVIRGTALLHGIDEYAYLSALTNGLVILAVDPKPPEIVSVNAPPSVLALAVSRANYSRQDEVQNRHSTVFSVDEVILRIGSSAVRMTDTVQRCDRGHGALRGDVPEDLRSGFKEQVARRPLVGPGALHHEHSHHSCLRVDR